ncbi:MAG: hypothetical protein LH702_29800, partial [Phormidesmis sp. CAN_BIN44]|nr:hypothetical protein [Phormidesmis sp. CAN_BIN44]
LSQLVQQFGQERIAELWTCLQPYQKVGWVEFSSADYPTLAGSNLLEGRIRLTDPEGFLFSNVILVKLFGSPGFMVQAVSANTYNQV